MIRLTFGTVNSAVIYKRSKGNENCQAVKITNARGVLPLQHGGPFLIFYLYFSIILPGNTPRNLKQPPYLILFLNHSCHHLVFYLFFSVSSYKNINCIGRGVVFTIVFPTSVQHISSSPKILVKLMVQKGLECLEWKIFLIFFLHLY